MKILDFEKTIEGRWYIVLPDWTGSKADLEMVWGADMLLNIYAQGLQKISLSVSETEIPSYDVIQLLEICPATTGGAYYKVDKINGINYNFKIWLCDVTLSLYGNFPSVLYFKDCTL